MGTIGFGSISGVDPCEDQVEEAQSEPPAPFLESFSLGMSTLWVSGQKIPGPEVICEYADGTFTIGGIEIPFVPADFRSEAQLEADLLRGNQDVPLFQEELERGMTIKEASHTHEVRVRQLFASARAMAQASGLDSAVAFLERSPLVSDAYRQGDAIELTMHGRHSVYRISPFPSRPSKGRISEEHRDYRASVSITNALRTWLEGNPLDGCLIVVRRDGFHSGMTGETRVLAERQLEHVRTGGSLDSLPPGRYDRSSPEVLEIRHRLEGNLTCPRESVHSQSQTYAEISTGPETTASGAGGR